MEQLDQLLAELSALSDLKLNRQSSLSTLLTRDNSTSSTLTDVTLSRSCSLPKSSSSSQPSSSQQSSNQALLNQEPSNQALPNQEPYNQPLPNQQPSNQALPNQLNQSLGQPNQSLSQSLNNPPSQSTAQLPYINTNVTSATTSNPITDNRFKPYKSKSTNTHSPVQHNQKSTYSPTQHNQKSTYSLGKLIGKGSHSTVRQITLVYSNIMYAVKIIPIINTKPYKIKREIEIMNILNTLIDLGHGGLVRMWDSFTDQRNIFIVMDYCKGGELYDYLRKFTLSFEQVRGVITRVTHIVMQLHALGIIHRDIKSENILLRNTVFDTDSIVLADYSLARRVDEVETSSETPTICGTQGWMAPELIIGGEYDSGVDMWAIGVLTFNALTRTMPFEAPNLHMEHERVLSANYTFPPEFDGPEYVHVKDFIAKLLRTNRGSRMTAAQALQHPFLSGESVSWYKTLTRPPVLVPGHVLLGRTNSTGAFGEVAGRILPWDLPVGSSVSLPVGLPVGSSGLPGSSPISPSGSLPPSPNGASPGGSLQRKINTVHQVGRFQP
jgi:serine/threonine protein kinase